MQPRPLETRHEQQKSFPCVNTNSCTCEFATLRQQRILSDPKNSITFSGNTELDNESPDIAGQCTEGERKKKKSLTVVWTSLIAATC